MKDSKNEKLFKIKTHFKGKSCTITRFLGPVDTEYIDIPTEINGCKVTAIAKDVFSEYRNLTSIIIPDGVTTIGNSAFYACISLSHVTIPNSVTEIGGYAFECCPKLKTIYYTGTEEEWKKNIKVARWNIIFQSARVVFLNIGNESNLEGSGEVKYHRSIVTKKYDTCLITNENRGLFGYTKAPLKNLVISEAIHNFGKNFTVVGIKDEGFKDCINIVTVTIPDTVSTIGVRAFQGCELLYRVYFGKNPSLFDLCDSAFEGCTRLTNISIPKTVQIIGKDVFTGCKCLYAIDVDENNTDYSSVNGVLFNKDKTTLIRYPEGKTDTEYTIPDTVLSINEGAFRNCTSLTNIILPDSVMFIGCGAFEGCSELKQIHIPNRVIRIKEDTFARCNKLASITIPEDVDYFGKNVFEGCTSLNSIQFKGSKNKWDTIQFNNSLNHSDVIPASVTIIYNYGDIVEECYDVNVHESNDGLTRKKLCEYILRKFCVTELKMDRNNIDFSKIRKDVVFGSTIIGICMEELGLISDLGIKSYLGTRGGTALVSFDKDGEPEVISFREILDAMKE